MPGPLHFVSDLHLPVEPNAVTGHFLAYLSGRAKDAEQLYLLGDIFETWMGDDVSLPVYEPVITALRQLHDSGTSISLMYGNRDFLMRKAFCQATGIAMIPDPTIVKIADSKLLLMHGDTLCTDDERYQKFRRTVRNPLIQFLFLSMPRRLRENMVAKIRNKTTSDMTQKSAEIMDVSPDAVVAAMQTANCQQLIHGHTHRPATHDLEINEQAAQRHVLTDWHSDKAEVLVWDEHGPQRLNLLEQSQA